MRELADMKHGSVGSGASPKFFRVTTAKMKHFMIGSAQSVGKRLQLTSKSFLITNHLPVAMAFMIRPHLADAMTTGMPWPSRGKILKRDQVHRGVSGGFGDANFIKHAKPLD